MDQLVLYNFQGENIRVFGTSDEPWFVLKDVANILGIQNYRNLSRNLDADEKGVQFLDTPGGRQKLRTVNDTGVYYFLFRSQKPEAREFSRFVRKVILPAIRKTGRFELEKIKEENKCLKEDKQQYLTENSELREELSKRYKLVNSKDGEFINISKRCVQLELLPKRELDDVYTPRIIEDQVGEKTVDYHMKNPEKGKMGGRLGAISKKIEAVKLALEGELPPILKNKGKKRGFTLEDYENFGDQIIKTYFKKNPYHTWGIDPTWKW